MRSRAWELAGIAVAAIAALVGIGFWATRPRPTLAGLDSLLAAGNYDAAEDLLKAYMRSFPDDPAARMMLARASLKRPDPRPEVALEQLRAIQAPTRRGAAEVKGIEGEAHFLDRKYDAAEVAWLEALRLDPKIAEIGWSLLNLYALQGREDDSRRLALRLFEAEPDPHDRVQLLLQLIRHDAHPISAGSVVYQLQSVVDGNPGDLRSALALGRAQVQEGAIEGGLALLRRVVEAHKESPEAWDAYLAALGEAGRLDSLAEALEGLPPGLRGDPRLEASRGRIAVQHGRMAEAARAYRRAWEARPTDTALAYRLKTALRVAGNVTELEALAPRLDAVAAAHEKLRGLYDRINAMTDLGKSSRGTTYPEVAGVLAQLGRVDEARAWERLAVDDRQAVH